MTKLTKIKLINWHLFSSQTIDIKDNTLISGENGAGKSTLLDALQYVLIGGKSGTRFNIAANENAKRSLENYIKGKIGAENKEFLRNKDVITHICLEFYSEKQNKYTILGCVLELPYNGILKEKFYIINNTNLEEETLISDNKPKNIQQIRSFFKKKDNNFDFFDTKKNYQKALEIFLNINITKYVKILPKALAFKPLNLQNFVFEFLLEENPIDIISLKNSVQQLKKIENQIKIEKKKSEKLKKIIECNQKIKLLQNQKKINLSIHKIILLKKIEENLKQFINKKKYLEIEIQNLSFQKNKQNLDLESINEKILKLKIFKKEDNLNILLSSLEKNQNENQNVIKNLENKIFIFETKLEKELNILKKISDLTEDDFFKQNIQKINFFLKNIKDQNYLLLQKIFFELSEKLNKEKISINIKKNNINQIIEKLKKEILQKQNDIEIINSILPSYNQNVIKLINKIKENLSCITNETIPIYPLCELIEIKEEIWRNSIEGFLGKRKFNLIIDARFFDQSLNIYQKIQSQEKIYDIGLVNVEQIPFIKDNENSLASKIKSDHKYALNYVKLLLSHIICELDIQNLKNHKTAITPQGMLYSNFTAQQLNPKTYKIPFIGINSRKIRKTILIEEKDNIQQEFKKNQEIFQKIEESEFLINSSHLSSFNIKDYILWQKELSEYISVNQKIKNEIKKIQNDPNLFQKENKLKNIEEEKKQSTKKLDQILFNIAEKTNQISILENKIIQTKEELQTISKELKEIDKKEIKNIEATKIKLNSYYIKYENNYEFILNDIKENLIKIEKQQNKEKIEIITQMNSYIEQNNLINIEAKIENIEYFIQEYNLINLKNLINYEQEARELSIKIEIIFKEEFVNKLKESLDNAKQQIQKLNEILKNRPFGNDYYQIMTKPSENIEYKKYYPIFMEKNIEKDDKKEIDLFIDNIKNYKKILLDELFEKITSFNTEYEKSIYDFFDYRNYLNYDIQIKDKEGNLSLFSKVFREKSGGETQVPFYIIITICFEQLLFENNYEKGCLVLFDEAFNNMDENRIDAMMSFFNELKIQFIIAVPPQRIINILPHITTNLIIIKEDDYAVIENFTIENEKKYI